MVKVRVRAMVKVRVRAMVKVRVGVRVGDRVSTFCMSSVCSSSPVPPVRGREYTAPSKPSASSCTTSQHEERVRVRVRAMLRLYHLPATQAGSLRGRGRVRVRVRGRGSYRGRVHHHTIMQTGFGSGLRKLDPRELDHPAF